MRNFIHWHGNKFKHINKIKKFFPLKYNTYIEPFLGSGAMFLHIKPSKWIINDIHYDLMKLWNLIYLKPKIIEKYYLEFKKSFLSLIDNESKKIFCKNRLKKLNTYSLNKKVVNYMCLKNCAYLGFLTKNNKIYFPGLEYNLIIGKTTFFISENFIKNIYNIHNFITNSIGTIHNLDYKLILSKANKGDFVFLDPPYFEDKNYHFVYNKDESININFLYELKYQLKELDKRDVKWLMTQADTLEVRKIFKKYNINTYKVYRHTLKKYVNELLICNYNI